jgi:hypothetical protein
MRKDFAPKFQHMDERCAYIDVLSKCALAALTMPGEKR